MKIFNVKYENNNAIITYGKKRIGTLPIASLPVFITATRALQKKHTGRKLYKEALKRAQLA